MCSSVTASASWEARKPGRLTASRSSYSVLMRWGISAAWGTEARGGSPGKVREALGMSKETGLCSESQVGPPGLFFLSFPRPRKSSEGQRVCLKLSIFPFVAPALWSCLDFPACKAGKDFPSEPHACCVYSIVFYT